MTVDDAGRRAGADLRARFDGLPAPAADLTVEPSRPRRRGALIGIAAVLIVVIVVALLVWSRDPEPAGGGPGGTWRRFEVPRGMSTIVAADDGFVGVGQVPREFRTKVAPAVWTSDDAEHWDRVRDAQFPSGEFWGFSNVAWRDGVLVASTQLNNDIWRSTDAETWRRVTRLNTPGLDMTYVSTRSSGFIAIGTMPTSVPQSTVWTSADGRRWVRVKDRGTPSNPVGLFGGARLGSRWISISGAADGVPPPVFESTDRIHWSVIPGAKAPERLNGPFVSNRRHTRVLAIQYERTHVQGSFGGRLWSTRNGTTWTEITSFHEQMPVANPDHIAQLGPWWVLGGNTGTHDGMRRASMWSSPDLRHWYEMPASIRGRKGMGVGVTLLTADGRVVGKGGHHVWVWTPPD